MEESTFTQRLTVQRPVQESHVKCPYSKCTDVMLKNVEGPNGWRGDKDAYRRRRHEGSMLWSLSRVNLKRERECHSISQSFSQSVSCEVDGQTPVEM